MLAVRRLEKPVVAAVNGAAAGAGASLALACDIVVAADTASFIQAFIKIGLIPDTGGTFFLPRLVGLARAAALMMLGARSRRSRPKIGDDSRRGPRGRAHGDGGRPGAQPGRRSRRAPSGSSSAR